MIHATTPRPGEMLRLSDRRVSEFGGCCGKRPESTETDAWQHRFLCL